MNLNIDNSQKNIPFTREELNNIPEQEILSMYDNKNSKLYPFCLIGYNLDEAKKMLNKHNPSAYILTNGQATFGNFQDTYYLATINDNKIITGIRSFFN
jgi:hypothetical protein